MAGGGAGCYTHPGERRDVVCVCVYSWLRCLSLRSRPRLQGCRVGHRQQGAGSRQVARQSIRLLLTSTDTMSTALQCMKLHRQIRASQLCCML